MSTVLQFGERPTWYNLPYYNIKYGRNKLFVPGLIALACVVGAVITLAARWSDFATWGEKHTTDLLLMGVAGGVVLSAALYAIFYHVSSGKEVPGYSKFHHPLYRISFALGVLVLALIVILSVYFISDYREKIFQWKPIKILELGLEIGAPATLITSLFFSQATTRFWYLMLTKGTQFRSAVLENFYKPIVARSASSSCDSSDSSLAVGTPPCSLDDPSPPPAARQTF